MFVFFPHGFRGEMWNLIVFVPDHCLCFYFANSMVTEHTLGIKLFFSWLKHILSHCFSLALLPTYQSAGII